MTTCSWCSQPATNPETLSALGSDGVRRYACDGHFERLMANPLPPTLYTYRQQLLTALAAGDWSRFVELSAKGEEGSAEQQIAVEVMDGATPEQSAALERHARLTFEWLERRVGRKGTPAS